MGREDRATWKSNYFLKTVQLFDEYPRCFIVNITNVRSKQMQQIRQSLRGHAVLLMGKNTMIRKAIRGHLEQNPELEKLLPYLVGNVGFVFTKDDLSDIRDKILQNRVEAPAKAGAIAPVDVHVPAQNTGLGPEKTSFFQALQIQTKISRGTIEILSDVHLIKKDDKVGASEAALLQMLKIYPFSYGLVVEKVFDSGTVFDPQILDITDADIRAKFMEGVKNIASISLSIGYPTVASVPHSIINGFKNVMAISLATDYTISQVKELKELLSDPEKLAAAAAAAAASAPAAAGGGGGGGGEKAAAKEEKVEEEEESDDDMGFGLFD